jgi:hypothetical protein
LDELTSVIDFWIYQVCPPSPVEMTAGRLYWVPGPAAKHTDVVTQLIALRFPCSEGGFTFHPVPPLAVVTTTP